MKFMLDENVPAAVHRLLSDRGFEVALSRDAVGQGEPDPVVAAAAQINNAILVSIDRDMRRIQRQLSSGNEARFPTLDLLLLACPEPLAARRIEKFLPIIEAEWNRIATNGFDERLRIELGEKRIAICR